MQIPIFPYDNDRLKTRKVQAMLDELGVLAADHSERPTFLKSHRAAAILIDRALASIPTPSLEKHCSNRKDLAQSANSKFAGAYALPNGTAPLIFLDFKNGIYTVNGSAVGLDDICGPTHFNDPWDPADIIPGVGLSPQSTDSRTFINDARSLVIGGATAVYGFSTVNITGGSFLSLILVQYPDYNTYYDAEVGVSAGATIAYDNVDTFNHADLAVGPHKAAATMIGGKIAISVDGNSVWGINPAQAWTVAPTDYNFSASSAGILETIGLYPAQADVDLPMLSAL